MLHLKLEPKLFRRAAVRFSAALTLSLAGALLSAARGDASTYVWTYEAQPMTLIRQQNPLLVGNPLIPLSVPNPFAGMELRIDMTGLDLSKGPVSFFSVYNQKGNGSCNGIYTGVMYCLTITSGGVSTDTIGSFGGFGSIISMFGSGSFGESIANWLSATVNPDLSVVADGFATTNQGSPTSHFAGSTSGDFLAGQFEWGYYLDSFIDYGLLWEDPDLLLAYSIGDYAAPPGTWKIAVVPLPGSSPLMLIGLAALILLTRRNGRRDDRKARSADSNLAVSA